MATKVYGASDDLVEFEGDVSGEIGAYGTDDSDKGVLLVFSDGTLLEAKYGKGDRAIWELKLLRAGNLFEKKEECLEETDSGRSDVVFFKSGLKYCYSAKEWDLVR